MAATLTRIDSFDHGVLVAGTAGPYGTITGSPSITTSTPRTGSRCLEISAAAAVELVRYTLTAGVRVASDAFYIRFVSALPSADATLFHYICTAGNGLLKYDNATGRFALASAGGSDVPFGPGSLAADTWYRVILEYDTSGANAVMKGTIDNGTEGSASTAITAADITSANMGTPNTHTFTARYDDWIGSETDGDYELFKATTDHQVESLVPTADGTHSISGANEIERTLTGTDITNATTDAYLLVDDEPMDTTPTDYINDVGTNTASYVEVTFENLAAGTRLPWDVKVLEIDVDSAASGASSAISRVLLSDSTAVAPDVRLSSDDPGTTVTMRKKVLTDPSGGWDRTKVDGLKARFGFGDGAPDSYFGSIMLEVAVYTPAAVNNSVTHVAPSVAIAAGTHIGSKGYHSAHTAPVVAIAAGTHLASKGYRPVHVAPVVAIAAGTHLARLAWVEAHVAPVVAIVAGVHLARASRPVTHVAPSVAIAAGTHTQRLAWVEAHVAPVVAIAAGVHVTRSTYLRSHVAPSVAIAAGTHTAIKSKVVVHVAPVVAIAAGIHLVVAARRAIHVAPVVALAAGTHLARLAWVEAHTAPVVTLAAGTHVTTRRQVHVAPSVAIAAGTHLARASYRRAHVAPVVAIAAGAHIASKGYRPSHTAPSVVVAAGTHLALATRRAVHVAPVVALAAGTHLASKGYRPAHVAPSVAIAAGTHTLRLAYRPVHVAPLVAIAAGAHSASTTGANAVAHVAPVVEIAAGTHSTTTSYRRSHVAPVVTIAAGTHVLRAARVVTHVAPAVVIAAGTHTAARSGFNAVAHVAPVVSISAGAHLTSKGYTATHVAGGIVIQAGSHVAQVAWVRVHSAAHLAILAGTHLARLIGEGAGVPVPGPRVVVRTSGSNSVARPSSRNGVLVRSNGPNQTEGPSG